MSGELYMEDDMSDNISITEAGSSRPLYRLLSLILSAALVAAFVSSCGEAAENPVGDADTAAVVQDVETEAAETSMVDARKAVPDDLPEKDYGGKEFRVSTKQGTLYEFYTEELDGELINDALYARNLTVEERFNVKIKPVITEAGDGNTQVNNVLKTVQAGDDAFDLAATYVFTSGQLVTKGIYVNLLDQPAIDFSKPWWINGINDCFRVGDKLFVAVGDTSLTTIRLTYAIMFNKRLAENYSLPDLYQRVRDNQWTIDDMIGMVSGVYSDLNGDGVQGSEDEYGFVAEAATNLDVYPFAFDIPIVGRDDDNIPILVYNTPKTIAAVEKINQLYWNTGGSYITVSDAGLAVNMFKTGQALFDTTWIGNCYAGYREMDDDYGILPYPKWDESQEKYMTGAMDNYSVLGIPKTETDVEFASIITEVLNAEAYKQLYPVYYEDALQNKYARDAGTIEMLDIIMQGRNFDMSTLFSAQIGLYTFFRELVASKKTDFASAYAKKESKAQKGLDSIIASYQENE